MNKKTREDFLNKAKLIHGNEYDYSEVNYVAVKYSVTITCPIHGKFELTPNKHLNGRGCQQCGLEKKKVSKVKGKDKFIEEANKVHNNKYDYSLVEYINNNTKIKVICPIHGMSEQLPSNHLKNGGCFQCGRQISANKQKSKTSEIMKNFKHVHGDKYDYSLVEYVNTDTKIKIICPVHGVFEQTPYHHKTTKCGCPMCNLYSKELSLFNLIKQEFSSTEVISQAKPIWLKSKTCPQSLDIYLPEFKIAIEYQGIQHFKEVNYFNSSLEKTMELDDRKIKSCNENGITLLHFTYTARDIPKNHRYKVYTSDSKLIEVIKDIIKKSL